MGLETVKKIVAFFRSLVTSFSINVVCLLKFSYLGAWAYKSSHMNLTSDSSKMDLNEFKINGEWDIIGTTVEWKELVLLGYMDTRYSKVKCSMYITYTQGAYYRASAVSFKC